MGSLNDKRGASEELEASFAAMLDDAIAFDVEERADERERALEYLRGVMSDTPNEPGRSSATSSEVSDVIGWLMPGLMRIFAGSANVVEYQPKTQGEEEQAQQASDYVSHVFMSECEGYKALYSAFHDALSLKNGVFKYWWDDKKTGATETLENLSEEQIAVLMQDEDVEILGGVEGNDAGTYTLKIRRVESRGRLRVVAIPPEEFLISKRARSEDDAPLVGHRTIVKRSDLVEEGFDKDIVADLPVSNTTDYEQAQQARGFLDTTSNPLLEDALQPVERFECYIRHDIDGDGIAEICQVIAAGSPSAPQILSVEEWPDEAPFASLTPWIVPHSWLGRSTADDVMPMQRVSTALLRQMLDNLYLSNRPQRAVNSQLVDNPNEIINPTVGGVIRIKGDPRTAIVDMALPFTAAASLDAIRFIQQIIQSRTGTSQAAAIMDDGALVPETATSKQIEHDASYSRTELIARNFAETGLKRMFKALLRLIVRHQDRPRTIRLRGDWIDFDPRNWNAGMDVDVNVGLGTGTKDRDLQMLRAIGMEQEKIIAQLGPDNPIVTPQMFIKTRHQMVTAAGLKNPDQYFADVPQEQFAQFMASKQQNPDPIAMAEAQTKAKQVEVAREKNHLDYETNIADLHVKVADLQARIQIEEQRSRAEIARSEIEMRHDRERQQREQSFSERVKHLDHHLGIDREGRSARYRQEEMRAGFDHALSMRDGPKDEAPAIEPQSDAPPPDGMEAPQQKLEPPREPSELEKLQVAELKQRLMHNEESHRRKVGPLKFTRGKDGRIDGIA